MSAPVNTPASAIPKAQFDGRPLALLAGIATLGLPLIGSPSTWLTLTVAGLAMGMIVFIIASGLTLVFGLMDVLNFGHGVFIALGAFVATSVMGGMADWTGSASGSGSGICSGPQTTLMISSPTIMPPMVMRICFRCWP